MKRIVLVLVVLSLLFVNEGSATKTEITLWHSLSLPASRALAGLIKNFEKANPNIQINVKEFWVPYSVFAKEVTATVAAGSPPHLLQVNDNLQAQLVEDNLLEPLSKFNADKLNIAEILRENNTWNNKLYGIPFTKHISVLYYNADLLNRYDLGPPTTWDELRALTGALSMDTDDDGNLDQFGLVLRPAALDFSTLFLTTGGRYLDDNNKPAFNLAEGVATLGFMTDLVKQQSAFVTDTFPVIDFGTERTALYIGSSAEQRYIEKAANFTVGVTTIPRPAEGSRVALLQGDNLVILSDHPDIEKKAAWKFAEFMAKDENTAQWFESTGFLPVNISAVSPQVSPNTRIILKQLDSAMFKPRLPNWNDDIIAEAVKKALMLQVTPEEALNKAAMDIEAIIPKRE